MNQSSESKNNNTTKVVIAIAAVIIVLAICITAIFLFRKENDDSDSKIGYATDAEVILDQDSLQAAVDEAVENAKNGMVALQYQNDAFSDDGKTFSCLIANSASNLYDMFLTIYADDALTDQLFLSKLVPPGSGFEEITLDHALDPGDHTVYVAVTQVDTDDDGVQVLKNQVIHTIEFHVAEV